MLPTPGMYPPQDDDDSEANWAKLLSFSQAEFPMGCATAWDPTRYDWASVARVRAVMPPSVLPGKKSIVTLGR